MMVEHETETYFYCEKLLKILKQYPDDFPEYLLNEELFLAVWAQVCTRVFGTAEEEAMMIPVGDSMNHSYKDVTYECINAKLHLMKQDSGHYYKIGKYLSDITPLYEHLGYSTDVIKENELSVKGRFNKKMYKHNK